MSVLDALGSTLSGVANDVGNVYDALKNSGGSTLGASTSAPAAPAPLFTQQVGAVDSSAHLAGQNAALSQGTSINQYIDSLKTQQKSLDNQSIQNQLAKQQGNQGILDWVGQGVRSGGVTLANKNASNSSAGDAIARAYSQLGRQQSAGVNQQFAQGQSQVDQGHQALQSDIAAHIRDLPAWKTQTVNSIISQAQQQLGSIDQTMAYMSMPDRVDMEAQKQQITQDVLQQLQGLDEALAGAQNVQPQSAEALQGQANQLFQAGTAPDKQFNYSTNAPVQFQNTGNFASQLPIFTSGSKKTI